MSRLVKLHVEFEVPDAATDAEILSVLGDAIVQVEEPVTGRPDDGSEERAWEPLVGSLQVKAHVSHPNQHRALRRLIP